jgi:hypothetical protein
MVCVAYSLRVQVGYSLPTLRQPVYPPQPCSNWYEIDRARRMMIVGSLLSGGIAKSFHLPNNILNPESCETDEIVGRPPLTVHPTQTRSAPLDFLADLIVGQIVGQLRRRFMVKGVPSSQTAMEWKHCHGSDLSWWWRPGREHASCVGCCTCNEWLCFVGVDSSLPCSKT